MFAKLLSDKAEFSGENLPERIFGVAGQPSKELSAPVSSGPKDLHILWLEKKGDDRVPEKSLFTPNEMIRYLPNIYLIDIIDAARDFRIRLFGTEVASMLGKDYTGTLLSDTKPELNWRGEIYRLAYERQEPVFYLFNLGPFDREFIMTENALFPLKDKEGNFSHLLCISVEAASNGFKDQG